MAASLLGLCALLACLLFAAGAQAQQVETPVLLAIGESTTAGFGVSSQDTYPVQLQALLQASGLNYRVVNHGRSGITTSMAMSTLDRGLLLTPKVVIFALGGNDRSNRMSSEQTRENLRRMISLFVRAGALVVIAERQGFANERGDSIFAQLAEEEGAILMPPLLDGVSGQADLLLADGRHPNAEGYAIVARRVHDFLLPHLRGL